MIIGITGLIGSGKTTAAKILKNCGMAVIDADIIGRKVVETNPALLKKLSRQFGKDILTPNGNLRRKVLAEYAFKSKSSKEKLNKLVHPYLLNELKKQFQIYQKQNKDIVIDAALLLDWKMEKICDIVIMIHASERSRLSRLQKRGMTITDARSRQKQQLPYNIYRSKSDYMILNNGSVADLKRKLLKFTNKKTAV